MVNDCCHMLLYVATNITIISVYLKM